MTMLRTAIILSVIAVLGAPVAAQERDQGPGTSGPPPAEVLLSLDLPGELQWYYQNDVSMLLVYAGDHLHRIDLLDENPEALESIEFPGLTTAKSVVPISNTGLLLIPDAPAGILTAQPAGARSSYAIDTLDGQVLWEAPPLPLPSRIFSFPDRALAVMRSEGDKPSLTAIDLLTGARSWERTMPLDTEWFDGRYFRLISGDQLVTLDVMTGEAVRDDELTLPKSKLRRAFPDEGVLIAWSNKSLRAFSMPPAPPAAPTTPRRLWKFEAGSPMMDIAIRAGAVYIERVADDLLLVKSVRHYELVRLSTGELVLDVKQGMLGFAMPMILPPGGEVIAVAGKKGLNVFDADSGEMLTEIKYPKGREGLKTARQIQWLGNDVIAVIFPDKHDNPRRISAFSSGGEGLLWTIALPEPADYELTSEQRAQLIGRIVGSLLATAVSVQNPMSIGGMNYVAVFVPDLDVSVNLSAGSAAGDEAAAWPQDAALPFARAHERAAERGRRIAPEATKHSYFATGPKRHYEFLRIGLERGEVTAVAGYDAEKVHSIAFFPGLERALSVEHDNRRVRLISLESKP